VLGVLALGQTAHLGIKEAGQSIRYRVHSFVDEMIETCKAPTDLGRAGSMDDVDCTSGIATRTRRGIRRRYSYARDHPMRQWSLCLPI
jgi:hypothetical protein